MNVITYNRVSDKAEEKILKNHRVTLREYCDRKGFTVVKTVEEIASGYKRQKALHEILAIPRGVCDIIIFVSLSRMTRDGVGRAEAILKVFKSKGIGWHFVDMPALNYDSNSPPLVVDILLGVLAAIDKDYRKRISDATLKKMKELQEAGKRLGRHQKGCMCEAHDESPKSG